MLDFNTQPIRLTIHALIVLRLRISAKKLSFKIFSQHTGIELLKFTNTEVFRINCIHNLGDKYCKLYDRYSCITFAIELDDRFLLDLGNVLIILKGFFVWLYLMAKVHLQRLIFFYFSIDNFYLM